MNGKRLGTMLLAASLGLNVALGAILITQAITRSRQASQYDYNRYRRGGEERGRSAWQSRYRSESDTTRSFPRLDRDQIESLRTMRREMEEVITPLREKIHALQAAMREELEKPEPDLEILDGMTGETARLQAEIQQQSLRLILKERQILSPEQYRNFMRMMMPGQYGPGESGRPRHGDYSERDSTRGSDRDPRRSSKDSRGLKNDPPPPPSLPHWFHSF